MSASFSKLTNTSLKEQAIRELEKSFLSGDFKPGDRLPPERELAAAMGISRSLINLCILELEHRGFVRIVPRHGTFVTDFKKQGTPQILLSLMNYDADKMDWTLFDNMMDMRLLLECECTRLAMENASEEILLQMHEALSAMELSQNIESFVDGNFSFHHALTAASGNAVYAMIFSSFETAIRLFLKSFFTSSERRSESARMHRALLNAIRSRDETAALDAIRQALGTGIAGLSEIFKQ